MAEKIQIIREQFQTIPTEQLSGWLEQYREDPRAGVQTLVKRAEKAIAALEQEKERVWEMQSFEREYRPCGVICGIDEAGRGPLAGPVVAAAVCLPENCELLYVNDSKKLSEKKREELFYQIREKAVSYGIGIVGPDVIDEINILQADYEAMRIAVSQLKPQPEVLLHDAVRIPGLSMKQVPIIRGDAKSLSIAAASILAKVTRDRMMAEYDKIYPEYGFAGNKGYGSASHIEALKTYGPCPIHRRSFIGHFVEV